MTRFLSLAVLALLGGSVVGRADDPPPEFQAALALDGWHRPGYWSSVVVRARNRGPERACTVSVLVPGETTEHACIVTLPRNSSKRVEVPFLSWEFAGSLLVRVSATGGGEELWNSEVRNPERSAPEFLVLFAGRRAAAACRPILESEAERPWARPIGLELLPETSAPYRAVQGLVLADPEDGVLSSAQAAALAEWIHAGGHLLLLWTPAWHALSVLESEIALPVEGADSIQLPGDTVAGFPETLAAAVLPRPDATVLVEHARRPIVVRGRVGAGRVTWIGVDLSAPPWTARSEETARSSSVPLWRTALEVPPAPDPERRPWAAGDENAELRAALGRDLPFRWISPWWLPVFTFVYAWAVGPGSRRLRRIPRPLAPLLVIAAFAAAAWMLSRIVLRGSAHTRILARVDLPAQGRVARGEAFGVVLRPDHARLRLRSTRPEVRLALLPEWAGFSLVRGAGGWSDVSSRVLAEPDGDSLEFTARTWTAEFLSAHWTDRGEPPVRARLVREGGVDRLEVANATGGRLDDLALVRGETVYSLPGVEGESAVIPLGFRASARLDQWQLQLRAHPAWAQTLLSLSAQGPREVEHWSRQPRRVCTDLRLYAPVRGPTLFAWSSLPVAPVDARALGAEVECVTLFRVEVESP